MNKVKIIKIRVSEELYNEILNYIKFENKQFHWNKLNISNFVRKLIYQELRDHKI